MVAYWSFGGSAPERRIVLWRWDEGFSNRPGRTHANCAIIEDSRIVAAKRLDPDSEQGGLDAVLPLFTSAFRELLSATGLTTRDCAGLAISTCGCGFRADANSFQP
jgi:hypothetical protein